MRGTTISIEGESSQAAASTHPGTSNSQRSSERHGLPTQTEHLPSACPASASQPEVLDWLRTGGDAIEVLLHAGRAVEADEPHRRRYESAHWRRRKAGPVQSEIPHGG